MDNENNIDDDKNTSDPLEEVSVSKVQKVTLELGDVIEIRAPSNPELNEQSFYIIYLDEHAIKMTNLSTFVPHTLKVGSDGQITDESISAIYLLSRSDVRGYARQHLLAPKTWVDIHFGGETPTIITGEITNLEEDMIEITTFPDLEVIYIDFAYKGIPEDLPLEQIAIRAKPASLEKIESLVGIQEGEGVDGIERVQEEAAAAVAIESSVEYIATGESIIKHPKNMRPSPTFREELQELYTSTAAAAAKRGIIYGEELESIVQEVEIPEYQKRYSIEAQANDMLDELLSEIPDVRRTKSVLDNIHRLIERFRELRSEFSKFDRNGNIVGVETTSNTYKPLAQKLEDLNYQLKWIVPVTVNRRKIYTQENPETFTDVIQTSETDVLQRDAELQTDFLKGRQRIADEPPYLSYYSKINDSMIPVESPQYPENYLAPKRGVHTDIDTIVQNLEDFYSTVYSASKEFTGYVSRRFVVQRYNLNLTHLANRTGREGKTVYYRSPIAPDDHATVGSFLVLPKPAFHTSRATLPGSSILDKTSMAQQYMYLFRILSDEKTAITSQTLPLPPSETGTKIPPVDLIKSREIQEFILDENLEDDPKRFRIFLDSLVPKTADLIETMINEAPFKLSMKNVVDLLEPFLVYSRDITYAQYNKIRYFIKENRAKYLKEMEERGGKMAFWRNGTFPFQLAEKNTVLTNAIGQLFAEKPEFVDLFSDAYKFSSEKGGASETLYNMYEEDSVTCLSLLLQYMMVSLIVPDGLVPDINPAREDMSRLEKIKAPSSGDCSRRSLTKRYHSVGELQKDNGAREIYYDTEFDKTPYEIYKKYAGEKDKHGSPEHFLDYLAETLIAKHDCPPPLAKEMARDLVAGKKEVRDGEYAVLEIRPRLPEGSSEPTTQKEKDELEAESNLRKRVLYYRRQKDQWIHDSSIDESAFIDNNTLFCNLDQKCVKSPSTQSMGACLPIPDAQARMREITRKKMLEEFDHRYVESIESLTDSLKTRLMNSLRNIQARRRLKEIQSKKYNDIAVNLGKFAKASDENAAVSPYEKVRDLILGQNDFVKRQTDIIQFYNLYCRDAMVAELGENFYQIYCKETNTPILPTFLYVLAKAFVSGDNYMQKVAEICKTQGLLSDDGDSWTDRYTGYEICKIELMEEQGYDDAGFRIITSEVMAKDTDEELVEVLNGHIEGKGKKDRVFENELSEMIYKIYTAIASNISLPLDSIEDFVLRVTFEVVEKNATSKSEYEKDAQKMAKDKGRRPPPYEIYYNKLVLLTTASTVLIGIQTAIPSFKIRKTFPGCVQSFRGFPDNEGSESDKSGLKYIACVLNKTKSSIAPWNSIKPVPLEMIQSGMQKIIQELILPRPDIMILYAKKAEYLVLNPDLDLIPAEHSVQKWTTFMPPLVNFAVAKSLKPLSSDYVNELMETMRKGGGNQRQQIAMFRTKCAQFGYGIIEGIREVVRAKDLLLRTASNMPFLENACCNDAVTRTALDYFIADDRAIGVHIKMVEIWEKVLRNVRELSRAAMIYHPGKTGTRVTTVVATSGEASSGTATSGEATSGTATAHFEENVYLAFIHYCHLERDLANPIPEDLRGLIQEKPGQGEYNKSWTLEEKMEFFKRNGKRFGLAHLQQLMTIINRRNLVETNDAMVKVKGSRVAGLREFLARMDKRNDDEGLGDPVIEGPLIKLLDRVLEKYNPAIMVYKDSDETRELNKHLTRMNNSMLETIAEFLQTHGNLRKTQFDKIKEIMTNVHVWTMDEGTQIGGGDESSMYSVAEFMKQSVLDMSKIFPEIICNNISTNDKVSKHWKLSENHENDLAKHIHGNYDALKPFMGDERLLELLRTMQRRLTDLNLFLEHIPVLAPMYKKDADSGPGPEQGSRSFYSLFSKRTLYMLYCYVWYSVLYEYILATDDTDLLQADIRAQKQTRRDAIRELADPMAAASSVYDEDEDDPLLEVQIIAGTTKDLKARVAELLLAFLKIDETNKTAVDYSYQDIEKRVTKSKQAEKKMITDFLKNMDSEERQVENLKKQMKMGRWAVGMQKGLIKYDKATYDREQKELLLEQMGLEEGTGVDELEIPREVEDLVEDEVNEAEDAGDQEAMDIAGLGENYMDGVHYEEDYEDPYGYGE